MSRGTDSITAEKFSLAAVAQAISRQLNLPPDLQAVVDLTGRLHNSVNQQLAFRSDGLDGSTFRNLVFSNLTPEIQKLLDPAQRDSARREQARNANAFSAEAASLGKGQWLNGQWIAGATRGDGGSGNSARFDSISGVAGKAGDYSSPAGQAYMRNFAAQVGVPWAANNPELLRLGPAALQTLADVHLRQDIYNRLTKEAGFKAKDVVGIARLAKEKGVDANKLGGDIADSVRNLSGGDKHLQRELVGAVGGYAAQFNDPRATEETKQKAFDKVKEVVDRAVRKDPTKKADGDKILENLQVRKQEVNYAKARAGAEQSNAADQRSNAATTQNKADVKKRDAAAEADAFNNMKSEKTGSSTAASQPASPKPPAAPKKSAAAEPSH
jgi:hypothetical protein